MLERHSSARAGLQALSGREEPERFRERLSSWDPDALARAVGRAQGELRSVRADRDALNEQLGALRQQISDMENRPGSLRRPRRARGAVGPSSPNSSTTGLGYAVTAAAMYDEAKRKYEAERQPEVLRLASRVLREDDGRSLQAASSHPWARSASRSSVPTAARGSPPYCAIPRHGRTALPVDAARAREVRTAGARFPAAARLRTTSS